ncbi:GreA/GreB family elongation factor [Desulfoscipio gibsoniae]|uniref:Transcription elongation factor n=1 Tax=Desulfoscipio gibsoniae DSM 7213 TaxID=767817 RepID=R4KIQ3_9FIRM|nr:GreA/GreB family elongation factor [Desulfoscipio gibsoniae]AGL00425.1 transcription elongation factor [Desulfoscipio gibsoniae DSM 7213]
MQYQVELTKKTYEKLIEGLVKVEEEKENLLNDFFPDEIKERNEVVQIIEEYVSRVSQLAKNIKITETADNNLPFVLIGSEVDLQDLDYDETIKLRIVLPMQNKDGDDASCLSPIGISLLLKKVGEEVAVQTPGGVLRYRVNSVSLPFF